MVIFLNIDGTAEKVVPERIFQGSNGVTDITVVAPFASDTTLQIGFILPDGLYWQSSDGLRYVPMSIAEQNVVEGVSAWSITLPFSVTEREGDVFAAINALTGSGNKTSYMCKFTVEESVLPNLPPEPEPGAYELIQQYIARLDARTANVPNLVADIQKASGNAFTFTDNKGVVSEPITLGVIDYSPSYVGAASVISIPNTVTTDESIGAWQPNDPTNPTSYSTVIRAAQHGQMRDGVTAHDLWVSFDETVGGAISGAQLSYNVNSVGDITIVVKMPIAATVRIWNGKGLADLTARESITEEATRAKDAENGLQAQINEIEQSGVDLNARAQIAAETARAEAEEAKLQLAISDEQSRASAAENALSSRISENTSDIQGLREDITSESHFRGMFNSIEALRAAYPTATPNDYAYIVGGNQWIWEEMQDGTFSWQDSGVASPNTSIPLGDSTPLVDGAASAGTSGAASRADHRHPTDMTRYGVDNPPPYPVITVNGQTGAVTLSASDIGALPVDSNGLINQDVTISTGHNLTANKVIATGAFKQGNPTHDYIDFERPGGSVFGVTGSNAIIYNLALLWGNSNRPTASAMSAGATRTNQTDTVVSYFRSSDGNSWYRVWSSGWKECGGRIPALTTATSERTITLPKSFETTAYTMSFTVESANTDNIALSICVKSKTTTSAVISPRWVGKATSGILTDAIEWRAEGY